MKYRFFETERLLLKPTVEEDAAFVFELFNSPKCIKYIGDRNMNSVPLAKKYIQERMLPQLHRLGYSSYTIFRKLDQLKIGNCGLYDREGLEGIDIGFALLPSYEKQGYAFEAASRLMAAAFTDFDLKSISGIATKDNDASQKLLEKLGLQRSGIITLPNEDTELLLFKAISPMV